MKIYTCIAKNILKKRSKGDGGSRIQVQISEYTIKLLQTNKYIISLKVDKTINTTE